MSEKIVASNLHEVIQKKDPRSVLKAPGTSFQDHMLYKQKYLHCRTLFEEFLHPQLFPNYRRQPFNEFNFLTIR